MHQEHNIPWNTLAANFVFIRDNPHITLRRTDLFARNLPTQARDLTYFSKTLTKTISTFSATESAKYPLTFDAPVSGKLFPDDLLTRYPEFLTSKNQRIEYWIARARNSWSNAPIYDTGAGDLADVVKILINENHISALLMLAHHPQIPLRHLQHLSWGHHFGFSRVGEHALAAYIFVNLLVAADMLRERKYMEMRSYRCLLRDVTDWYDFPAQQLPHRAFFGINPTHSESPDALEDLEGVRAYLKTVFALLYRYDVLVRECGVEKGEEDVVYAFSGCCLWGVKVAYVDNGSGGAVF